MTIKDVEPIYLGFPQHIVAFTNGGIDVSLSVEPSISRRSEKSGKAVRFLGVDEFYPNFQTAAVFYSEKFIKERPEDAKKFMRAYLRGARDYNDALDKDRLTAPAAADVIAILTEYSFIKNPDVYRTMRSHYVDPNGVPNVDALKDAWQFFKDTKQIDGSVTVDQVVDLELRQMGRGCARTLQEEDRREIAPRIPSWPGYVPSMRGRRRVAFRPLTSARNTDRGRSRNGRWDRGRYRDSGPADRSAPMSIRRRH